MPGQRARICPSKILILEALKQKEQKMAAGVGYLATGPEEQEGKKEHLPAGT
jgi:hypothetical protein